MFQIILFVVLSAVILYVSRASLRAPRSHGFQRFFAWEFMAALFALNAEMWFVNPLAWQQLISWFLLVVCLVPLAFGVRALVSRGKPAAQRASEPQLLGFEKTSALVTTGIYHYIRHPLYSSLLFLTWGIFFKAPGVWGGLLALAATFFLFTTARADEAECSAFFGPEYREYMKRSRMFVPYLF